MTFIVTAIFESLDLATVDQAALRSSIQTAVLQLGISTISIDFQSGSVVANIHVGDTSSQARLRSDICDGRLSVTYSQTQYVPRCAGSNSSGASSSGDGGDSAGFPWWIILVVLFILGLAGFTIYYYRKQEYDSPGGVSHGAGIANPQYGASDQQVFANPMYAEASAPGYLDVGSQEYSEVIPTRAARSGSMSINHSDQDVEL